MNRLFLFTAFVALFFVACSSSSIQTINVSDYGIVADTKESVTVKINELIKDLDDSKPVKIVFPKGRYDFYPDDEWFKDYFETNTYDVNPKKLGVYIEKKKNITIDAMGSDFIFHGHMQPFTLDHVENVNISNVNIDWDIPLTAESEVIEADSEHVLLKIDISQFPYKHSKNGITFICEDSEAHWAVSGGSWLIEYDPNHVIPAHTGDHGSFRGDLKNVVYETVEPGKLLLKGNFTKYPAVGNHLIMRHSTRDHAGMFLFHSKDIKLENINVYHTSGLGILSQYSENIDMKKVNMIPNPHKNRYLSGHDDGLHFMGCKGQINIDACKFQGLMDDPINIHGTCVPVIERIDDNTLKCKFAHDMSSGLIWGVKGDKIGVINSKHMVTIQQTTLNKFTPLTKDTFVVHFSEPLPKQVNKGYALENLTWTPSAKITNCFVGSCRARGFLISTPGQVLVENNVFETSGSAILIAGDANYWYESGAVTDIQIRNNKFTAPCNSSSYQFCEAVISIFPEIPEPDLKQPFHSNIVIENNTFEMADYPVLYALSVDGLTFSQNTITRSELFKPRHFNKQTITLDACKNVSVDNNKINEDVLGKNVLLKRQSKEDIKIQDDLKVHM
ncbi:alpha-1,3-galactosidase B [Puteibacter caeruleilacunae]|nr:alpha-1,3-galactosidase B [Puteibacter caeruleilacunae]